MAVKADTIKAIFTNLLFLIGVILIVIGFIQSVSITAKLIVFESYPLNSYEENRCNNLTNTRPAPVLEKTATDSAQPTKEEIQQCKVDLEQDRKLRMVEDVTRAIGFLTSGIVISAIFRRFIFK